MRPVSASRKFALAFLVAALASCGNKGSSQHVEAPRIPTDDNVAVAMPAKRVRAENVFTVRYTGKWEFVSHRNDGRYQGESVRSYHVGDSITVVFSGNRLRIYGIRGNNGGVGTVVVPGKAAAQINFYARTKATHVLLYDSGPLKGTIQTAGIVVSAPPRPRQAGYVNIDEMQALTR